MAIVTLFSAAGSPGATTTALALTLAWPRPAILVDADPNASNALLAGYLQGQSPAAQGLIDLAIAHRHGELANTLPAALIPLGDSTQRLLPGLRSPLQAPTIEPMWPDLLTTLDDLDDDGVDVLIDMGRLGARYSPHPAITFADTALLVTRTTLPAVVAANAWLPVLTPLVEGSAVKLGLSLVGSGHPYGPAEISRNLAQLPVLTNLALDPVTAEVFSLGRRHGKHHATTPLVRSARAAAEALHASTHSRRQALRAIEETPHE